MLLRCFGAMGELWLDEVWTIRAVRQLSSFGEVLTWNSDNNHLLNSFWIELIPFNDSFSVRLFSLAASAFLLVLPAIRTKDTNGKEALFCLFLVSLSYPFVVYGSEARGYSLMLAALAGAYFSLMHLTKEDTGDSFGVQFQLLCCLAVISHGAALQAVAAMFLWCVIVIGIGKSVKLFWLTALFSGVLWLLFYSQLPPGSGALDNMLLALIDALSTSIGGPTAAYGSIEGVLSLFAAIFAVVLGINSLLALRADDDKRWILFALAIFVVPAALVLLLEPRVVYARYFLPGMLFYYFLLAAYLKITFERNRKLALISLGIFAAANSVQLWNFICYQRSSYRALLAELNEHDVLKTDQDFRQGAMLRFYGGEHLPKLSSTADLSQLPDWAKLEQSSDSDATAVIVHDDRVKSFARRRKFDDKEYCLKETFIGGGLSGWNLALYRSCDS